MQKYEQIIKGSGSMHGQIHWKSKLKYLFDSYAHALFEKTVRILLKTSSAIVAAFAYASNSSDVMVAVN